MNQGGRKSWKVQTKIFSTCKELAWRDPKRWFGGRQKNCEHDDRKFNRKVVLNHNTPRAHRSTYSENIFECRRSVTLCSSHLPCFLCLQEKALEILSFGFQLRYTSSYSNQQTFFLYPPYVNGILWLIWVSHSPTFFLSLYIFHPYIRLVVSRKKRQEKKITKKKGKTTFAFSTGQFSPFFYKSCKCHIDLINNCVFESSMLLAVPS